MSRLSTPGTDSCRKTARSRGACAAAGITFVGPTAELLDKLGDKTAAKRLARDAGVPTVPGVETAGDNPAEAFRAAEAVGFPLMVKAAFGGGGRGMRVVRSAEELKEKFEEAQKEAQLAFGNGAVFMERFVSKARHIEVQILGDSHGSIVHLWERDCSVQRRHQKVVEMAPAANLSRKLRSELCESGGFHRQIRRLCQCRNGGVSGGRRNRGMVLHRGQPAYPGRTHRDGNGHGGRPRSRANSRCAGLQAA